MLDIICAINVFKRMITNNKFVLSKITSKRNQKQSKFQSFCSTSSCPLPTNPWKPLAYLCWHQRWGCQHHTISPRWVEVIWHAMPPVNERCEVLTPTTQPQLWKETIHFRKSCLHTKMRVNQILMREKQLPWISTNLSTHPLRVTCPAELPTRNNDCDSLIS